MLSFTPDSPPPHWMRELIRENKVLWYPPPPSSADAATREKFVVRSIRTPTPGAIQPAKCKAPPVKKPEEIDADQDREDFADNQALVDNAHRQQKRISSLEQKVAQLEQLVQVLLDMKRMGEIDEHVYGEKKRSRLRESR